LLAGEPGIGKTRIAEELCALAEERGASVYWGQCFEGEGAPSFWPWVQVLRAWIRPLDPETVRRALGPGAADIGLILPELRGPEPDLATPAGLGPAQARFRLFDLLASFLRRTAADPRVIVVDDLHWADEPSLLLLELLAEQVTDAPVLILGTYRDAELTPGDALSTTLGSLTRRPHVQRLSLGRLSPAEGAELVEAVVEARAALSLINTVVERAEGNPLFMGEMLRLVHAERLDTASESALGSLVPPTLHDVIGRRLGRLSEACRQVLTVAAVIGREFDLATLRSAFVGDPTDVMAALDEAEAVRVIAPVATHGLATRFRFTHGLVRDALYDAQRTYQRARLHLRVATALEHLPEPIRAAPPTPRSPRSCT
jgi:predicted ATPase